MFFEELIVMCDALAPILGFVFESIEALDLEMCSFLVMFAGLTILSYSTATVVNKDWLDLIIV